LRDGTEHGFRGFTLRTHARLEGILRSKSLLIGPFRLSLGAESDRIGGRQINPAAATQFCQNRGSGITRLSSANLCGRRGGRAPQ